MTITLTTMLVERVPASGEYTVVKCSVGVTKEEKERRERRKRREKKEHQLFIAGNSLVCINIGGREINERNYSIVVRVSYSYQ